MRAWDETAKIVGVVGRPGAPVGRLMVAQLTFHQCHRAGEVFFTGDGISSVAGQRVLDGDMLDLIAPFETEQGRAPDLYAPRPSLRIIPGKLSGSPHIVKTRIETIALAALRQRGLSEAKIAALYPMAPRNAIAEALDLEHELQGNVRAAA